MAGGNKARETKGQPDSDDKLEGEDRENNPKKGDCVLEADLELNPASSFTVYTSSTSLNVNKPFALDESATLKSSRTPLGLIKDSTDPKRPDPTDESGTNDAMPDNPCDDATPKRTLKWLSGGDLVSPDTSRRVIKKLPALKRAKAKKAAPTNEKIHDSTSHNANLYGTKDTPVSPTRDKGTEEPTTPVTHVIIVATLSSNDKDPVSPPASPVDDADQESDDGADEDFEFFVKVVFDYPMSYPRELHPYLNRSMPITLLEERQDAVTSPDAVKSPVDNNCRLDEIMLQQAQLCEENLQFAEAHYKKHRELLTEERALVSRIDGENGNLSAEMLKMSTAMSEMEKRINGMGRDANETRLRLVAMETVIRERVAEDVVRTFEKRLEVGGDVWESMRKSLTDGLMPTVDKHIDTAGTVKGRVMGAEISEEMRLEIAKRLSRMEMELDQNLAETD